MYQNETEKAELDCLIKEARESAEVKPPLTLVHFDNNLSSPLCGNYDAMLKYVIQHLESELAAERKAKAALEMLKELNGEIMRLLDSVSGTLDIRSTLAHVCVLIQVKSTGE